MQKLMCFENKKVEIINLDGMILFNPYHVGKCIDLSNSAVRNYLQTMNKKQAILLTNSIVRNKDIRKMHSTGEKFITESGLYKLIFKSRKSEAERFTDWVTDEVLPSIRKTGRYIQPTLLDVKQEEPLKKLYYNGKRVMTANQIAQVTSRSTATIFNITHKHDIKYEQLDGKEVRIFRKDNDLYPNLAFIYVFPYKSVSDIFRILGLNTKILNDYFGTMEIEGKKKHEVYDNLISVFFNTVDSMEMKDILNQELIYLKENNDSEQMVSMMMDFFKMLKIRVSNQTK